ncbi:MAG TPA: hypothetical protein VM240_07435 [Verrucomicrobiae bacterium]|nr:hypothetical protein [Verrucomicrobiae bacterium]
MKHAIIGLAALALLGAVPAVQAQKNKDVRTIPVQPIPEESAGASLNLRASAALGFWDGHAGASGFEDSDGGAGFGLGTGTTFVFGSFFADLGVDYYDISQDTADGNEFTRSDLALTGGGWLTDWISAFGGYRQGWQGRSGAFKDDIWTESGFFAGGGVAFPIGQGDLRGGVSMAYNLNTIEFAGGSGDLDYNGFSGKFRVALARSPHAVELRLQSFKASEEFFYLRESYAFVAYVFNWQALSF